MRMNARCERSDQLDDNTLPEAGEDLIVGNYYPRFRVHSCILRRSWPEFDKVLGSILLKGVYTQNFRQLPRGCNYFRGLASVSRKDMKSAFVTTGNRNRVSSEVTMDLQVPFASWTARCQSFF